MKAQELIKELGQVLHLPSLALDESNVCRVIFDGHAVDFEALPDKDEMFFIAELGPVPAEAACFRRMLEANRYGLETGGATLSIDPDREAVILHRQFDLSAMNYPTFEQQLEIFFERLKFWKNNYCEIPATGRSLAPSDLNGSFLRI